MANPTSACRCVGVLPGGPDTGTAGCPMAATGVSLPLTPPGRTRLHARLLPGRSRTFSLTSCANRLSLQPTCSLKLETDEHDARTEALRHGAARSGAARGPCRVASCREPGRAMGTPPPSPHSSQGLPGWAGTSSRSIPWDAGARGHPHPWASRSGGSSSAAFPALLKTTVKWQINTHP